MKKHNINLGICSAVFACTDPSEHSGRLLAKSKIIWKFLFNSTKQQTLWQARLQAAPRCWHLLWWRSQPCLWWRLKGRHHRRLQVRPQLWQCLLMQGLRLPPFSQSSQAWYSLTAFKWEDGGSFYYMPLYLSVIIKSCWESLGKSLKLIFWINYKRHYFS